MAISNPFHGSLMDPYGSSIDHHRYAQEREMQRIRERQYEGSLQQLSAPAKAVEAPQNNLLLLLE